MQIKIGESPPGCALRSSRRPCGENRSSQRRRGGQASLRDPKSVRAFANARSCVLPTYVSGIFASPASIPQRALSQLLPNIHVHHPARRKAPRNPQPSPSAQKKRGEKPIVKRWISQFNYLYAYGTRRGARARSHGWLSILDLNCWSVFSSEVQVVLCAPQRRSRFVQRSSCRGSTTTRTRCPGCDGLISLAKHVF